MEEKTKIIIKITIMTVLLIGILSLLMINNYYFLENPDKIINEDGNKTNKSKIIEDCDTTNVTSNSSFDMPLNYINQWFIIEENNKTATMCWYEPIDKKEVNRKMLYENKYCKKKEENKFVCERNQTILF